LIENGDGGGQGGTKQGMPFALPFNSVITSKMHSSKFAKRAFCIAI
jgi:hypothetical protein